MLSQTIRASGIQVQQRDIAVLKGLFESRVATTAHIASLYFDDRKEAAKKRLQTLKALRVIAARPRKTFEPAILVVTREGLALLRERGVLGEYPTFGTSFLERRARVSDMTIRHEIEVMETKALLCSAIKKSGTALVTEFNTWPVLNQFQSAGVLVKPDGFFHVEETTNGGTRDHYFFLEVDRSTEVLTVLANRASAYLEYYKSGAFAEQRGAPRSDFRRYPFRALFVLQTTERRNNIAERLLCQNPPVLTNIWLTTAQEIATDPLGSIWVRPIDYRDAVPGALFARTRYDGAYLRQTARDSFIASKVRRYRLLD